MLNKFSLLIGLVLFFPSFTQSIIAEKLNLTVTGEAAILMNADTGAILYEKNAHVPHYPASTTKIATALYALPLVDGKFDVMIAGDQECIGTVTEEAKRRSKYTLPSYLLIPDASHMAVKKGELLSLKDLFYGLMVISADDAANLIAKYVSGTIPEFMQNLNGYLKSIGCNETNFNNPHGLHHPDHLTTAYDLAIMTKEALKNPVFREMAATVRYMRPKTNKQEATMMVQTNRLLRSGQYHYAKAIGVKTGYYSLAGSNLVAAAVDGDRTLIAVIMKAEQRKDIFMDTKKMFETAFNQPKVQRILVKKGPQRYELQLAGAEKNITTFLKDNVTLDYFPAEEIKVKCLLYWQKDLKLPIKASQIVGELVVQNEEGLTLKKASLYAQENVESTFFFEVKNFFNKKQTSSTALKILGAILVIAFIGLFAFQLRRKK